MSKMQRVEQENKRTFKVIHKLLLRILLSRQRINERVQIQRRVHPFHESSNLEKVDVNLSRKSQSACTFSSKRFLSSDSAIQYKKREDRENDECVQGRRGGEGRVGEWW